MIGIINLFFEPRRLSAIKHSAKRMEKLRKVANLWKAV